MDLQKIKAIAKANGMTVEEVLDRLVVLGCQISELREDGLNAE